MNAAALFWSRPVRVFDLDGTLVDTLPQLTAALNRALHDLALPAVDAALVRDSLHEGLEGSVAAALQHLNAPLSLHDTAMELYFAHLDSAPLSSSAVFADAMHVLSAAQQDGALLAVCTNKPLAQAQSVLRATGLDGFFQTVVGADTCARRKPDPAPLLHALQTLGGTAAQAVLIGDSHVDAQCASAARAAFLWFARGYGERKPAGVSAQFDAYAELMQMQANRAAAANVARKI